MRRYWLRSFRLWELLLLLATHLLTGIIIAAAILLIGNNVAPEWTRRLTVNLLPLFAIAACGQMAVLLSLFFLNRAATQQLIAQLQTRSLGSGEVRTFVGPTEFHAYLALRFPLALVVQVTHFSSGTRESSGKDYEAVLDEFVMRGGTFRRVIVDTLSPHVWEAQRDFLQKYASNPGIFLHYLEEVAIDRMKALDIMLIDDVEVCLGGGYSMGYEYPTISIRHPEIVTFFVDYYRYLREKAMNVRIDPFPEPEIIDRLIARKTLTWPRAQPTGAREEVRS